MAGKKGQRHTVKTRTARQMMWQTMRIKARGFTVPDLLMTVPGARRDNAQKLVARLAAHGIIREIGTYVSGSPGSSKTYKLALGAETARLPDTCPRCGGRITAALCTPKETDHDAR